MKVTYCVAALMGMGCTMLAGTPGAHAAPAFLSHSWLAGGAAVWGVPTKVYTHTVAGAQCNVGILIGDAGAGGAFYDATARATADGRLVDRIVFDTHFKQVPGKLSLRTECSITVGGEYIVGSVQEPVIVVDSTKQLPHVAGPTTIPVHAIVSPDLAQVGDTLQWTVQSVPNALCSLNLEDSVGPIFTYPMRVPTSGRFTKAFHVVMGDTSGHAIVSCSKGLAFGEQTVSYQVTS